LSLAASPSVAERIGYDGLHFVRRHLAMLPLAMGVMLAVSLQPPRTIRRIAVIGFAVALALLALTFVVGAEIKGARRWINLPGLSVQPSEFIKPTFAVVAAWLFSEQKLRPRFPGNLICILLFLAVAGMLIKQPDIGMAAVVAIVWFGQFFMAGLRLYWVVAGAVAGLGGLVGTYLYLPHVRSRIDHFLDPSGGDTYQVKRSIEAFANGGLWGKGPGEGTVKDVLPDAHADFVFAVAGEEFGLVVCLVIIGLFAFIVLRGFSRLLQEGSLFVLLAATGLLVQFGLQAVINMASSLHLIPTKGMTLPFLSYGGSSMLALGLGMGMMLALTRRRLAGSAL
jgi:cell division protein FtsW